MGDAAESSRVDRNERRRRRFLVKTVVVAAVVASWVVILAAPSSAAVTGITSGGSIVYIKDNNVWISAPDGSKARQLTTLGTASQPLGDPTMSDDGSVIVAVQNRPDANGFPQGWIYEFDRSGKQLRAPFHPTQYTTQLGGSCTIKVVQAPQGLLAAVSPDGKHIALNPLADNYTFDCGGLFISYVYVVDLTGTVTNGQIKPSGSDAPLSYVEPAWVNNTRLLLYHDLNNADDTYVLGNANASHWIASSDFSDNAYQYPSLRSSRLATTGGDDTGNPVLRLWTGSGPPNAPTARCDIPNPDPTKYDFFTFEFVVPRMAPDGGGVVWEEIDKTGSTPKTAVYVSPVGDISTGCSSIHRQLLVSGASDPFWSPASPSTK
jgi:hypothetical protein